MIDFPIEKIIPACEEIGVRLTERAVKNLNIYANLLIQWNEKMNLTAITEPSEVVWKHFYDCILFFKNINLPEGASVIDVGTGAGFPGMVLKIVREDIKLTLLDGLNKRLVFLEEVLSKLSLQAEIVHLRAEEGGRKAQYREKYDYAVSRAVANMNVLCEYCLPFVKKGGSFVALKGPSGTDEVKNATGAIKLLGGDNIKVFTEENEFLGSRHIVEIKKVKPTGEKYPRPSAKISKSPLR
ncbi:MAG: 16S rRNA (guanine(527)-N(7))-methyltransferase RsmG [Acutalibacteraceae bacterium]|nr:16S rRNA (guanine(527)-N(7))-methyltransferase RsmG [Acutalibacteraceae bacterium]